MQHARVTNSLFQETICHLVQSLMHSALQMALKFHEGPIDPSVHPGVDRGETLKEFARIPELSRVVIQSGDEKREWPIAPTTST